MTKPQAHSDSYWEYPETFGLDVDIMCEAKHKEKAVFALREMQEHKSSSAGYSQCDFQNTVCWSEYICGTPFGFEVDDDDLIVMWLCCRCELCSLA